MKETSNVLVFESRPEVSKSNGPDAVHVERKIIEDPQNVQDRIQMWLDDSDRVQTETESMVTLVPVDEVQATKIKKDSIRRKKDLTSNGLDTETPSEIASSEFFDNSSIIPLKRSKKNRPSESSPQESLNCPRTEINKRKKIGRNFWNDEEDDCLKEGLLKYGPETRNRWAKIKASFFPKSGFKVKRSGELRSQVEVPKLGTPTDWVFT